MGLTSLEAHRKASEINKLAGIEWMRLRKFVRYARGRQTPPWLPDSAETEYREIAKKSASNWPDLVLKATGQGLHVDGFGPTDPPGPVEGDDEGDDARPNLWDDAWQASGMDARQHALHRAVLTLGYSYLIVLPSSDPGRVWMRPESATNLFAVYDDPTDEWPQFALRQVKRNKLYELFDGENRYTIRGNLGSGGDVEVFEHGAGRCPVVKMQAQIDLFGDAQGEIEPVIPIFDRIIDATFTLQMVAKYGAFPQRWIAGLDVSKPLVDDDGNTVTDSDGNPVFPAIKAYVDHILTAVDAETKFGQFAAADLRQYVEALEAHIRHLAAITQTPPHYLLGSIVNLSAEALAAAESGLQRKIRDRREVLGEGYEQAFRLAAVILEDEEAAVDTSSQVHWQDVESRSLAQVADALVKLRQLGVPRQQLFQMIPGWTEKDATEAAEAAAKDDIVTQLMAATVAGQTSPELPPPT